MMLYKTMKAPKPKPRNLQEALEKAHSNGYSYIYAVECKVWTRIIYTNDEHYTDPAFWTSPYKRYVVADEMAKLEGQSDE
jgi:hypothetical protein